MVTRAKMPETLLGRHLWAGLQSLRDVRGSSALGALYTWWFSAIQCFGCCYRQKSLERCILERGQAMEPPRLSSTHGAASIRRPRHEGAVGSHFWVFEPFGRIGARSLSAALCANTNYPKGGRTFYGSGQRPFSISISTPINSWNPTQRDQEDPNTCA